AGRVRARDSLVERGLERVGVEPPEGVADHLLARAAGHRVGIEARLRVEAEDPAGAHVDERDAARELAAEGLVHRLLDVGVDREPEVAPGARIDAPRLLDDPLAAEAHPPVGVERHLLPAHVHEALLPAARAAEVALPGALDAGDADPVALDVARAAQRGEAIA